jgi:hypothetical protein
VLGLLLDFSAFTQLIYLTVHKGFFICRLSQMGKRGGIFNIVNFRVKLLLFPLLIVNQVILERGLICGTLLLGLLKPLIRRFLKDLEHQRWVSYLLLCRSNVLL